MLGRELKVGDIVTVGIWQERAESFHREDGVTYVQTAAGWTSVKDDERVQGYRPAPAPMNTPDPRSRTVEWLKARDMQADEHLSQAHDLLSDPGDTPLGAELSATDRLVAERQSAKYATRDDLNHVTSDVPPAGHRGEMLTAQAHSEGLEDVAADLQGLIERRNAGFPTPASAATYRDVRTSTSGLGERVSQLHRSEEYASQTEPER